MSVRYGVALARRGARGDAVRAGAAAGLGLLVQPFDVVALVGPLALFWLLRVGLSDNPVARRAAVRAALPGVACLVAGIALLLATNFVLTGHGLRFPLLYYGRRAGGTLFGFGRAPFGLPPHTLPAALGQLGVAVTRLNVWLFGWPLSLLPIGLLATVGVRRRDGAFLLPIAGGVTLALLATTGMSAISGPLILLPVVPFLGVAAARGLAALRLRIGDWVLGAALATTLVAAGGFWRLVVIHETGAIAQRAAAPGRALQRQRIAAGLVIYSADASDYFPVALTHRDPVLWVREGESAAIARSWLPSAQVFRYINMGGKGELLPID